MLSTLRHFALIGLVTLVPAWLQGCDNYSSGVSVFDGASGDVGGNSGDNSSGVPDGGSGYVGGHSDTPCYNASVEAEYGLDEEDFKDEIATMTQQLDTFFAANGLSAMSATLVYREQTLQFWNNGVISENGRSVDSSSLFRIASLTKLFTIAMMLKLRDEGHISLHDPVAKLFNKEHPDYLKFKYPEKMEYAGPGPTLMHLASFTAGVSARQPPCEWMNCDMTVDEFLKWIEETDMYAPPGVQYDLYSNTQITLLGRALERVVPGGEEAKKWEVYMRKMMDAFGMTDSYPAAPPKDALERLVRTRDLDGSGKEFTPDYNVNLTNPSQGATASSGDMAKFMKSIMRTHAAVGCGNQVLDGTTLREWHNTNTALKTYAPYNTVYHGFAFDSTTAKPDYIYKSGENPGQSTLMVLDPNDRLGFFVTTATAVSGITSNQLLGKIFPLFDNLKKKISSGYYMKFFIKAFSPKVPSFAAYQPLGASSDYIGLYQGSIPGTGSITIAEQVGEDGIPILVCTCTAKDVCDPKALNAPLISLGSRDDLFVVASAASSGPPPNLIAQRQEGSDVVQSFVANSGTFWNRDYMNIPSPLKFVRV